MISMDVNQIKKINKNFNSSPIYCSLSKKKLQIFIKRVFDILLSFILIVLLSPLMLGIAIFIKIDSPGSILYKQERVTQYKRIFLIYKFRTMVVNADKTGSLVTVKNDSRITRVGNILRKFKLDELPQLFNIIKGEMSFVGTRPEVLKYVNAYTPDMYETFYLPAGVTSLASIKFKDENTLLESGDNTDEIYINKILPEKMKYNLEYLANFSILLDIKLIFMTVAKVLF